MTVMTLKIPERLAMRIAQEARRRRTTKSEMVRLCIERELDALQKSQSLHDLAKDLCGYCKGPRDLATNPSYLNEFGR